MESVGSDTVFSYIRSMLDRAPTYCLGPDFDDKLDEFVDRFLAEGSDRFSGEFANLDEFITKAKADQSDQQDKSLRSTARDLYLLEAVSFKLYDRLNREAFNRAKDTLIIMPDCLSLHNPDCCKTDEPWGDECTRCTPDCQANEICDLADEYGIETVFSKRKLSEQIQHYADRSGDLGVIGVACLLMLATGMRAADDLKIPARGVLLNCTGCEHWNNEPFASPFYLDRLKAILEEKYGKRNQTPDV